MTAFATAAGRRIAYETWGDPAGVPVLSLHGTPGSRLGRHPDEERLAATGARLITYDRPGYGLSDRHAGRAVVDCVADVTAIVDHLGVDRFAVQGGSGGGPHCLAVAARLPDRVLRAKCVVGIAPWGLPDLDWFGGMDPMNVTEFGWALQGEQVLVPELEREAAEMVARVAEDPSTVLGAFELSEADRAALDDEVMQRVMRESVPASFTSGVWGWVDDDLAFTRRWGFDLADITVPVEVRYGATDVLVPASHGEWLARNVPGAEVHVEHDEGHMGDPERILAQLAEFVAAASAA
jgi:pimeloyl-ACP methyl ester carboxylesterase